MFQKIGCFKYFILFISLLVFRVDKGIAQPNKLEQKVTIQVNNVNIANLLYTIEQSSNIKFSYNSKIFHSTNNISANFIETPLSIILKNILGNQYKWIETKEHIVILKNDGDGYWMRGILIDSNSNFPIENASVVELETQNVVLSDQDGKFAYYIKSNNPQIQLAIRHVGYLDTIITFQKTTPLNNRILLTPSFSTIDEIDISAFHKHWFNKRILGKSIKINSLNLSGYFNKQTYQFSLLPGVGSKHLSKSQSVNKFSFNVLGGYVKGVDGFELGTLFNIVQNDMKYCQVGGLFNVIGGNIKGVQIGGAYNYGAKNLSGIQFVGFVNYLEGNSKGLMIAGALNRNDSLNGLQFSGLMNLSKEKVHGAQFVGGVNIATYLQGWQIAGLSNITLQENKGVQIAGAINYSFYNYGVQCSGLANINRLNSKGLQIAGGINYNKKSINGLQVAGLLNVAGSVKGMQIGIINICDSTSGPNLGLINIVRHGKKTFSLSSNEWQLLQMSYKSGAHHFYNVLQVGIHPIIPNRSLSVGYGIGWQPKPFHNWSWAHEITGHTIYKGNWNDQNLLLKFESIVHKRLNKRFQLYAGPSLNLLYQETQNRYINYTNHIPFKPTMIYSKNKMYAWFGLSLGISFQ